ncbi:MAG: response regulator [Mariniphaga sp.]
MEIRNNEPDREVIAPETVKKRPGNNLKILITDDDFISGKLANRIVLKISREIISANSGREAIEICRNNPDIDLILMDISMPQIDGYEVTRQIRQFNEEVIIIAQTAKASAKDIEDALKAGCNDHIPKPINGKDLLQIIQKYFDETEN